MVHRAFGVAAATGLLAICLGQPGSAAEFSWNTGDGFWNNPINWTPHGVPGGVDTIRIGDLPGVQHSTVLMGNGLGAVGYDHLEISSGMTLDLNGSELVSFREAWITGANSRLIARPHVGINQADFQGSLRLGNGAHLELHDNVSVVLGVDGWSEGVISGRGEIEVGDQFRNDGVIRPDSNGGLTLKAGHVGTLPLNLDGTGFGHLLLDTPFSVLQVEAGNLTDPYSGAISMAPGALLDMNIADGWAVEWLGVINVAGLNNPAAASQIDGTHFDFGGHMNIGADDGRLRVLARTTLEATAEISIAETGRLEMDGQTTVLDGRYFLGQGAQLDFHGPTSLQMQNGWFATVSNSPADGFVAFNGETDWRGNVTIEGAARQNGDATVSGGLGAVVHAGLLDMDGQLGDTVWDVNANLVIHADQIGTTFANRFDGTFNIAGGFLAGMAIDLTDPDASWTMGGEMNVAGDSNFFITRVGGSHMIVEGELNLTGVRSQIAADATFAAGSVTDFAAASTILRLTGVTRVESNATFAGPGRLNNASAGHMTLADGAALDQIGLLNEGMLEIGDSPGVASVDRFENGEGGSWLVEIGGYASGDEHDLLIVSGGSAQLDGFLNVDLIDVGGGLFLPQIGDEFVVLTSLGGVNGMFLNSPVSIAAGRQYHWSVDHNPNDVTLRLVDITVPEPTSLVLLATASLAIATWACRKG